MAPLSSAQPLWTAEFMMRAHVHVCFCACVCGRMCMWVNVSISACVSVCVGLFGGLRSRCAGLFLCSNILNGWRRHFCGFPALQNGISSFPRFSLLSSRQLQDRICSPGSAGLWKAYMNMSKLAGSSWSKKKTFSPWMKLASCLSWPFPRVLIFWLTC